MKKSDKKYENVIDKKDDLELLIYVLEGNLKQQKCINSFYNNRHKKYLAYGLGGFLEIVIGISLMVVAICTSSVLVGIGLFLMAIFPLTIGSVSIKEVYDKVNYFKGYDNLKESIEILNKESYIKEINLRLKGMNDDTKKKDCENIVSNNYEMYQDILLEERKELHDKIIKLKK